MVYKFFDKKSSGNAFTLNQIISSQMNFLSRLSKNLKDKKTSFRDNIWGVAVADMQSLSK